MFQQEQWIIQKRGAPQKMQRSKLGGIILLIIGVIMGGSALVILSDISSLEHALNNQRETTAVIGLIAGLAAAIYGTFIMMNPIMLRNNAVTVYADKVVLYYRESVFSLKTLMDGLKNMETISLSLPVKKIDSVSVTNTSGNEILEIIASGVTRRIPIIDAYELSEAIQKQIDL